MGLCTPNIDKLKKENNISDLLRCLDHRKPAVRYRAFTALATRKNISDTILNILKTMKKDPDHWVKTLAVLKFAELGDFSISENLMNIISFGTRNHKIDLLKIITANGPTHDYGIIDCVSYALSDKNEIVRKLAIIAASATGNNLLVPNLLTSLHEKHHKLRILAANALYNIKGDKSANDLIGLLMDKHSGVRDEAGKILAGINTYSAHMALHDSEFISIIKGMNGREPIRKQTAKIIGDNNMKAGLPLLHSACSDKYKGVRINALKAMAVFKNPSSIEFAQKLQKDKYQDVRIEAIKTLSQIVDRRSKEAIHDFFNDKVIQVRDTAKEAYDKMNSFL
jgi:HEAT repeat protein